MVTALLRLVLRLEDMFEFAVVAEAVVDVEVVVRVAVWEAAEAGAGNEVLVMIMRESQLSSNVLVEAPKIELELESEVFIVTITDDTIAGPGDDVELGI